MNTLPTRQGEIKVYVAGSSKEIERAEAAIAAVRGLGFSITFDWPAMMRASAADHELTLEEQERAALISIGGVASADIVWLLIPHPSRPSAGAWFEAGYAKALGDERRTWIASGPVHGYIFARVADVLFPDDDRALRWLAEAF
jgi:nucleoside 2-deoxyribosyltransferase